MNLSPQTQKTVTAFMADLALSNNGYATTYSKEVADVVQQQGLPVICSVDPHGRRCFKAFTLRGQAAVRNEDFGVSMVRPMSRNLLDHMGPDWEAMILESQEHLLSN